MYVRRMSGVNAIRELAQNSVYMAQNSTKLAQKSQCLRSAVTVWEHGEIDEYDNVGPTNAYDTARHYLCKGHGSEMGMCSTK